MLSKAGAQLGVYDVPSKKSPFSNGYMLDLQPTITELIAKMGLKDSNPMRLPIESKKPDTQNMQLLTSSRAEKSSISTLR
ncbi:hypothetical protein PsorP6_001175 [Peronosclerospora sorghi]|uniref:Uncharacterized protein n=1 Tax=Peronosclerospora sorghi TaxID=230839 RepID=A0ACC0WVN1_9STRA|nr:hypothetical protein PsorP6_001175 [Peronosclerospora sorghi]